MADPTEPAARTPSDLTNEAAGEPDWRNDPLENTPIVRRELPTKTAAPHWKWHSPSFASLMLGRIELAQINQGTASEDWYWTLRFTENGERPSFSAPTEYEAIKVCQEHARKVLS